jgi:hypothetical protein
MNYKLIILTALVFIIVHLRHYFNKLFIIVKLHENILIRFKNDIVDMIIKINVGYINESKNKDIF